MPFLHRYLGTPVINFIINLLYAKKTKIRDSNSGFRCFTKEAYLSWNVKSTGMEFASELLIQSLLHESKIHHVPVSLWPDKEGRIPHLKTWRDGMRHLLRILFYAPHLFEWMGIGLFILSYSNLLVGTFTGIVHFDGFNLCGGHSMIVFSFSVSWEFRSGGQVFPSLPNRTEYRNTIKNYWIFPKTNCSSLHCSAL